MSKHGKHNKEYYRQYNSRPEVKARKSAMFKERNKKPEVKLKVRNYLLIRRYGLSLVAFNSMLVGQNNYCAVCKSLEWDSRGPVVDHDHKTGKVRGIVCGRCNRAIGLINDSHNTARLIAEYLEKSEA